MARKHARLLLSIWDDRDFTALDPTEQIVYLGICSSRDLSWCGVAPLLPKRLIRNSRNVNERKVRATRPPSRSTWCASGSNGSPLTATSCSTPMPGQGRRFGPRSMKAGALSALNWTSVTARSSPSGSRRTFSTSGASHDRPQVRRMPLPARLPRLPVERRNPRCRNEIRPRFGGRVG